MNAKIWVLLAIVNLARSRDIIVGSNDFGHKIYDEDKRAGPAIWRQMENITIATNDTEVISKIVITDLRPEKDGDARVVEGGEGQRNVTVELKSPTVLRGYDFHIEVYAVAEDQLKNMGQNSENPQRNMSKEQPSTPTSDVTASVDKQLTSTTVPSPTNEASINRRQNRDTENKDKSTQDIKNTTPSLTNTASTSEKSNAPLPNASTLTTEKADQIFPIVNREFQQGHTFDHPRVNVYEVNKLPESTARTIPSTNAMSEENIHTEKPLSGFESNKDAETNVNAQTMHTHVRYPQLGVDGLKFSQEPVLNTASHLVDEDKNKNVRHRRDVIDPIEEKKDGQKHFGADNKAGTTNTTPKISSQEQKHDDEHAVQPATIVTSNPSLKSQQGQDVTDASEPNQNTELRGRHIHRRFGNEATSYVPLIPTSTEDNKVPTPKEGVSIESANKFINSRPNQLGKEPSGGTIIPEVTELTPKLGSSTEKLANPALEPKGAVQKVQNEKSQDINIRHTRDTTSVTSKIISESLLPPILRGSSTTLKPEVSTNNAKTDANTTESQPILRNSNVTIGKSEETIMGTAEKDRNTRGAIDAKNKKVEENVSALGLPKTIETTNILSEHELKKTINTQKSDKIPIENRSKDTEKSPSGTSAEFNNSQNKERQTRDTSSADESKDSKKEASTEKPDAGEIKTKLQQETKLNNDESTNLEKSISSTVDDKTAKHNYKIGQPRDHIPVWNKEDQEESSKASNGDHENENDNKQSPKNPREAKESEGSKKAGGLLSNTSLATDLHSKTTEKPTPIKPVTKNNKEDDLKKPNDDDISKNLEKPE